MPTSHRTCGKRKLLDRLRVVPLSPMPTASVRYKDDKKADFSDTVNFGISVSICRKPSDKASLLSNSGSHLIESVWCVFVISLRFCGSLLSIDTPLLFFSCSRFVLAAALFVEFSSVSVSYRRLAKLNPPRCKLKCKIVAFVFFINYML